MGRRRKSRRAREGPVLSRRVLVSLEHGIHARPAALLAGAVKGFAAEVTLVARGREASARSTVALMTLGVRKGDEVEIRATGADAEAALSAAEASAESRKRRDAGVRYGWSGRRTAQPRRSQRPDPASRAQHPLASRRQHPPRRHRQPGARPRLYPTTEPARDRGRRKRAPASPTRLPSWIARAPS